jgi:hypothetical protein
VGASLQRLYPKWFPKDGTERTYSIIKEIEELEKYWNELLFTVTDGKASEMHALKKYDIIEFFSYVDNKIKKDARS